MSFSLTTPQFRARTKFVTRRIGWWNLKPGDVVCGVVKGMGLKKGEKVERLGLIRIVGTQREELERIQSYPNDTALEGFPEMTPEQFIQMFAKHHGCDRREPVNRIQFEYLDEPPIAN